MVWWKIEFHGLLFNRALVDGLGRRVVGCLLESLGVFEISRCGSWFGLFILLLPDHAELWLWVHAEVVRSLVLGVALVVMGREFAHADHVIFVVEILLAALARVFVLTVSLVIRRKNEPLQLAVNPLTVSVSLVLPDSPVL